MDDLDILINTHGIENYRATHRGRESKREYHIFLTSEKGQQGFDLTAFYVDNGKPVMAGYYNISNPEGKLGDPKSFIRLNRKVDQGVFIGDVTTLIKGEGIASSLIDVLIDELRERKFIHVEGFSEEGVQRLRPKLIEKGYRIASVVKNQMPGWAQNLDGWLAYNYG